MNTIWIALVSFGLGVILSQFVMDQVTKLTRKNK